jgi:hypothetical protein
MRGMIPALGVVIALAFASLTARSEERAPVQAREGSVSVGGSVSNSTITIGVPPDKIDEIVRLRSKPLEDLSESQKKLISRLEGDLDLNQRQVKSALEILAKPMFRPNGSRRSLSRSPENSRTFKRRQRRSPATMRKSPP